LLLTIMLLTFADCGRIADNRHEFFEDAFIALWSKHDNRKDGFERDRFTRLQKSEFLRLLSAFAASSYSAGDYELRDGQFRRHFVSAEKLSGVSCKEDDFLKDLTISTCLMVEDGPYVRFCHRSFQEYFAAVFVADTDDEWAGDLIDELSDRIETDNVLPMLLSINEEKIEKHWVLVHVRKIVAAIKTHPLNGQSYAGMAVGKDSSFMDVFASMLKVRLLYTFQPDIQTLLSAFDATAHMHASETRLLPHDAAVSRLFKRDRNNFEQLLARLELKYSRKSSALQALLGQAKE
jgi:hypothetical protein